MKKKILTSAAINHIPAAGAFLRVLQKTMVPAEIYAHSIREDLEIKLWI